LVEVLFCEKKPIEKYPFLSEEFIERVFGEEYSVDKR